LIALHLVAEKPAWLGINAGYAEHDPMLVIEHTHLGGFSGRLAIVRILLPKIGGWLSAAPCLFSQASVNRQPLATLKADGGDLPEWNVGRLTADRRDGAKRGEQTHE